MKFTSAYTCGPNCQPTRAALMSGQYGARTGVYTVGNIDRFNWQSRPLRPADNVTALPLDKITIADRQKELIRLHISATSFNSSAFLVSTTATP